MAVQIKQPNPMSFNNTNTSDPNCLANILRIVDQRQKEVILQDSCLNCEANLGEPTPTANTRPFVLYLPNGDEFSIRTAPLTTTITTQQVADRTTIFRVEEVRGNCALIRGLRTTTTEIGVRQVTQTETLECTPYCAWVNLSLFVGIQFFRDVFINVPCPQAI